LSVIEFSFRIFNHLDAFLLSLRELVLKFHDLSRWSADLKIIKINKVTEPEHLTFVILTLSYLTNLFILLDDFLHLFVISLISVECLLETLLLLIKLSLPVDQLQELSSGKHNRFFQMWGHEVTSVILFVDEEFSLLIHVGWVLNSFLLSFHLNCFKLSIDLIISDLLPLFRGLSIIL